jgi:uncharacterized protein
MKRYADPYVAGFGLGLVLLASFALSGRGVGVSGAFRRAAAGTDFVDWTVIGILAGGFLSALLARRVKFVIENKTRLTCAFAGGAVMGAGAYLARGCTSGLALTGGALLGAGSWIFMLSAFAAAYALAPFVRKTWN